MSSRGFNVEQNPVVPGRKNPDYKIDGEVFDNYAPQTSNARNIWSNVRGKIEEGQTTNIVLNLKDSKVNIETLEKQFSDYPANRSIINLQAACYDVCYEEIVSPSTYKKPKSSTIRFRIFIFN